MDFSALLCAFVQVVTTTAETAKMTLAYCMALGDALDPLETTDLNIFGSELLLPLKSSGTMPFQHDEFKGLSARFFIHSLQI